jgi:hypoxanthine phosphoribosyltransferase
MGAEVSLWERRRLLVLDWETAGELVDRLVDDIRASGFLPDVVVGIARGGLPLAVALSHRLGVADFRVLGIQRNASDSRYSDRGSARLDYFSPDGDLTGRRVLVAEDIVGDGGTLAVALPLLTAKGAAEVRTATLVRNVNGATEVDYEGVVVDDWTVFPWESPAQAADATVKLKAPAR